MNAGQPLRRLRPEQAVGLALVLALHAAGLYGLWQYRLKENAPPAPPVFVDFIKPETKPPPPPPPRAVKIERAAQPVEAPRPLTAEPPPTAAPPVAQAEVPVPPPREAPPADPAPVAAGPVTLKEELSIACPQRTPPAYPMLSRRRGETGTVVVSVELDERGAVALAEVSTSSGSTHLDAAALAAVREWKCTPARRGGQAVRALAQQPFIFKLEGR